MLVAITAIAAVIGALVVAQAHNWAAMTDELLYTGMGRSIASTFIPFPQVRGSWIGVYQVLYPTVISPIVGSISMPVAYSWVAVLNAAIFASAAVPVYLLTNFVTENRSAARWVAVCTVVVPWLSFASKALPDSLAYVAILWCAYAMARTIRPEAGKSPLKGDLLTLVAITLTYLVRNQFLLLAGVWVGAVVLARVAQTLADGSARDLPRALLRLITDRPIPIFGFLAILLVLKLQPEWLLGVYLVTSTSAGGGAAPPGTLDGIVRHLSVIGFGIAGIPLVLGLPWLTTALVRFKQRPENSGAIVILLLSAAILFVGATFNLRFTEYDRVIERYVFYFAPLAFVAMAGMLTRPPKSVIAFAIPALIGLLLLGWSRPYGLDTNLTLAINHAFSPVQIVLIPMQNVANTLGTSIFGLTMFSMTIVAVLAWWLVSIGRTGSAVNGLFALTAAITLFGTAYSLPKIVDVQNDLVDENYGKRTNDQKAWVDKASGGVPVALAFSVRRDPSDRSQVKAAERTSNWWDLAFWNGSIDTVYTPTSVQPQRINPFPGKAFPMLPDWQSGNIARAAGDDSRFLLQAASDPRFQPQYSGTPVVNAGFVLRETGSDLQAAWATKGLTFTGWVPPSGATLRVWAPGGAGAAEQLTVRLLIASPNSPGNDLTVADADGLKRVRVGRKTLYTWTAKLPAGGHADFGLKRGARPAHVESIRVSELPGSPDKRR